jgi:hypothetical protein
VPGFESGRRENMTMVTSTPARTIATVSLCFALGATLTLVPSPGLWWNVIRWPFYLPIFLIGVSYGPSSGLACGVAVALFCVFVAVSRGTGDSWRGILAPDFAVVGLLGGFSRVWSRSSRSLQPYFTSGTDPVPSSGQLLEPEIGIDLNPLASIEIAAGLLAQDDTSAALRRELVGIVLAECEHLSASIQGALGRFRTTPQHDRQVEIAAIVEAAVEEIEFVLGRLGVTVGQDIAPGVPPIQCNPNKIRTLLVWLAINAAQSDFAGNQIVLHARGAHDGVIFEVGSRGRRSFIRRAANRFFESRLEPPDVVVYDAVRQCGGKITRSKDLRKGSDFSLWLPLRQDYTHDRWQSTGGGRR